MRGSLMVDARRRGLTLRRNKSAYNEMLITIPDVLSADEVKDARAALWMRRDWVDGKVTAGYQAQGSERELAVA